MNFQGNWSHERIEHPFYTKRRHLEHSAVKVLGSIVYSVKTFFFFYEGKTVEILGCRFGTFCDCTPDFPCSVSGFSQVFRPASDTETSSRAREKTSAPTSRGLFISSTFEGEGGVGLSLLERRGLLNLGKMMV